jgi:selenide,water dikinase
VEVLRQATRAAWRDTELVLIAPDARSTYSGMLPGVIGGRHAPGDAQIDLPALAARAGATFVQGTVQRVHGAERWLAADGIRWTFDSCSLDVGSAARVPAASTDAPLVRLRPIGDALGVAARVVALPASAPCVVVGGGAAGVEVACAVYALRVRHRHARGVMGARRYPLVTLVQREDRLLPGFPRGLQRAVSETLTTRGIGCETGAAVTRIDRDGVHREGASVVPAALVIWAGGAAPPPLLAASVLPCSPRGYFAVDDTLRAVDGSAVWGAGDCVDLASAPWVPKAGVYAVRQGPVLARNLLAALTGGDGRPYRPQRHALALLDLADGTACAARGALWWRSAWLRHLKDAIDRRFLAKYR